MASSSAAASASAYLPPPLLHDRASLLLLIKSCSSQKSLSKTRLALSLALSSRLFPLDLCISTALLSAFAKSGSMSDALSLFRLLPSRNSVTWTALISGYTSNHSPSLALLCFLQMQREGVAADSVTFACVFKACAAARSLAFGRRICAMARKRGLLRSDILVGNAAVAMFAKCGDLSEARRVFDELPVRDSVSWNTMIGAYTQHQDDDGGGGGGGAAAAIDCFRQMQTERIRPDIVTYIAVLKACASALAIDVGKEIDAAIRQEQADGRLLQPKQQIMLATALIDMYAKCGDLELAVEALERSPARDAVSWTALIAGYVYQGEAEEALRCFVRMQEGDGISPDAAAYACALRACGMAGSVEVGEEIGVQAAERGLLAELGKAMVVMYAECGEAEAARRSLERLEARDAAAWNALLAAYARRSRRDAVEVLRCFREMEAEGVAADTVTYGRVLKACAAVGSAELGRRIDGEMRRRLGRRQLLQLGDAIVGMYGKCGEMAAALVAFERIPASDRGVAAWNALIAGYAKAGMAEAALGMFWKLVSGGGGGPPDEATFLAVLAACSHGGLVAEGAALFGEMGGGAAAPPAEEAHYTCMVDMFARAGDVCRAAAVLLQQKDAAAATKHVPQLLALMGACRSGAPNYLSLGRWVFQRTMEVDQACAASYVCMASIYAAAFQAPSGTFQQNLEPSCSF